VDCIAEFDLARRDRRMSLVSSIRARARRSAAFTLIETLFASAIIGILVVALYAAIATATSWMRVCQENETATQIMSEKLDTLRLYNWDQITKSNGFLLTNFTVGIDPLTNSTPYYTGNLAWSQAPISESYASSLLLVTIKLTWLSEGRLQTRSNSTFVTTYGIQELVNHN
jgi:prepilin-type N-terminal cleavage/methylation domain-containing protein